MNIYDILYKQGRLDALELQNNLNLLDKETLYNKKDILPDFNYIIRNKNINERPLGFTCISPEGRIIKLTTLYNSNIFLEEPEQLSQNWDFIWSTDPKNALPFIETDHSPYNIGECCTVNGEIYRSTEDNNTKIPVINLAVERDNSGLTLSPGWEKVE